MKNLIIALTVLLTSSQVFASGHVHHQADSPAVHGMAVVGTGHIYLSHFPMFHTPHDYQVILEVEFDAGGTQVYNESKSQFAEPLYTIAPEVFNLPEMLQSPHPFKAQLYRGHFERGGALIADQVTVKIKTILYAKKFSAKAENPANASFLAFGNADEQFLAHVITAKPDFDQLVSLQNNSALADALKNANGGLVVPLINQDNKLALLEGQGIKIDCGNSQTLDLKVQQNLYLETGDLSF